MYRWLLVSMCVVGSQIQPLSIYCLFISDGFYFYFILFNSFSLWITAFNHVRDFLIIMGYWRWMYWLPRPHILLLISLVSCRPLNVWHEEGWLILETCSPYIVQAPAFSHSLIHFLPLPFLTLGSHDPPLVCWSPPVSVLLEAASKELWFPELCYCELPWGHHQHLTFPWTIW